MIAKLKSSLWKTAPCEEAIAEADELLMQLPIAAMILLAWAMAVVRWL